MATADAVTAALRGKALRDRYLAASIFSLYGSEHAGNPLVERIRAVLKG